jgi:hypothetical protein
MKTIETGQERKNIDLLYIVGLQQPESLKA